jgi:mRNA interferase MazF
VRRGEIWWAELPVPKGSGPGYRRPVLIVQADPFNRSGISTAVAAVISSNLRLADAPGNIFLSRRLSGLPKDSVVNISQVVTLDRKYLSDKAGNLSPKQMSTVDDGLRLVLSL